jgi:endonuclease YncB( thermonuclease family)
VLPADLAARAADDQALAVIPGAGPAEITGRASVIDGDTIEIHGQRIRLHGVDVRA